MSRTCTVEGCDGEIRARGLCGSHYQRLQREGLPPRPATVGRRLKGRLAQMPNGCLEWTGTTVRGYGRISVGGRMILTHRLAWELAYGPIPPGVHVLHRCDNPPCAQIEPTDGYPNGHLFLGTHADNMADRDTKGRGRTPTRRSSR